MGEDQPNQAVDTSTPSGRLPFTVLSGIAEFERDVIRERTRAGLRAAKKRGRKLGGPRVAVDYVALLEGLQRGETIASIARRLGVSRHVVRREMVARGCWKTSPVVAS